MKTIIIGGGASGMLCAYYCALAGDNVTILEKNEKLGKKLFITGKGRCNLTNDCSREEFLKNVITNSKFMYSAINSFDSEKTISLFESFGLKLKTERGRRVFPLSDKSSDVIKTLSAMLESQGVTINLNETVVKIDYFGENNFKIITNLDEYECQKVVVCTGGISYSSTGSTGDGYKFAINFGHKIIPPKQALCPIELEEVWCKELMGLSLKNVTLTLYNKEKVVYSELGEMLFTHYGISGPIVLSASSYLNKFDKKDLRLVLDLKPALSMQQLDDRILRDFLKYKNKEIQNSLDDLLPKSLIKTIIDLSSIDPKKKNQIITKQERLSLVNSLKNINLTIKKLRPFEEAIITSGGVDCKEINPKTMESKLCKGLFFAGEVIDVDAKTGGYNLQIAFSTAYVASGYKENDYD